MSLDGVEDVILRINVDVLVSVISLKESGSAKRVAVPELTVVSGDLVEMA